MSKYISQFNGVASAISGDLFLLQRSSTYKKIDFDDLVTSVSTSIGAGVTTLAELTDVDMTYLSDNDVLQYNSSTLKWECVPLASSVTFSGTAGYIAKFSSTTDIDNSGIYYASSTTLGFFGVTAPSFSFGLLGTGARSIGVERHTTADTAGNNLTIQAGGATSTATNKSGGVLILSSGISTGTGSAGIQFYTSTAGASGTTDRVPTLKASITGSGHLNMEVGGYIQFNGYTYLHYTNAGSPNPQTNGSTFLGYNSGLSNNGNGNTGIGQEALKSVGNGTNNTATGRFSLTELTTGVNNVAYGFYSGSGITSTSYNAFFGAYAGSNSSGSYNTGLGQNSLPGNTSGSYNTAVGVDALYSVTSGSYNTATGCGSFNGTTITGSYNTVNGANAGVYMRTTSSYNTFVGADSGCIILTGPFNYGLVLGAKSTLTASNTAVFGGTSDTSKINTFYLGTSPLYDSNMGSTTQSTITIMPGGTYYNSGNNMGGHNLAVCSGLATGDASSGTGSGNLLLQTTSINASGSTLGTATTRVTILGGTGYVGMQGITAPTAFLHLAASTTAAASLCIPSGTAPSSPVNGDIWFDGTDLKLRSGGATYTLTKV